MPSPAKAAMSAPASLSSSIERYSSPARTYPPSRVGQPPRSRRFGTEAIAMLWPGPRSTVMSHLPILGRMPGRYANRTRGPGRWTTGSQRCPGGSHVGRGVVLCRALLSIQFRLHFSAQLRHKLCVVRTSRQETYRIVEYLLSRDSISTRCRSQRPVFDCRVNVGREDRDSIVAVADDLERAELLREIPQ